MAKKTLRSFSRQVSLALTAFLLGFTSLLVAPSPGRAAGYPDRPIRIIVPFEAGGGGDIIVRLIGQELSQRLGQPVLVENRTGASGNIGTDYVAHARPDGYTLLMANVAPMAINAALEHPVSRQWKGYWQRGQAPFRG